MATYNMWDIFAAVRATARNEQVHGALHYAAREQGGELALLAYEVALEGDVSLTGEEWELLAQWALEPTVA